MLIVKKFGGTSVGSVEKIQNVARIGLDALNRGERCVIVVSAMAGETNRLVSMASQVGGDLNSRDYDMLLATGEQVTCSLMALALNSMRPNSAQAFLGFQAGIFTDTVHSKARIQSINTAGIEQALSEGKIPVIAGFQGIDPTNSITTLGRGGSDTSAVALAAALNADDCEIYTDVEGVYSTDPRICKNAKKIDWISYEEMMELASLGAKVLQIRSVELAAKWKVPLHVRSTFNLVEGTRVVSIENLKNQLQEGMENPNVVGVAYDKGQTKFSLRFLPDDPGTLFRIFDGLSRAHIVVDVIVQNAISEGRVNVSFTVSQEDTLKARDVLKEMVESWSDEIVLSDETGLAKVSIVGVGMRNHPGVATEMFKCLSKNGISVQLTSTSEIKISCLISQNDLETAVNVLHEGFGLG